MVKSFAQSIFHLAGGIRLVRQRNSRQCRILMYHHFDSDSAVEFDFQCAHIRRYYNPVSLDQVAAMVCNGVALPPNAVAVTVDDGYRDFYLYGYPALKRHNIPATVFLMTGFMDGMCFPWWGQLRYAFLHTPLDAIELRIGPGETMTYRLDSEDSRLAASEQTAQRLKDVPNDDRLDFMARLQETFRTDVRRAPDAVPLTWDEAREMMHHEISFGAHSVSHPILSSLESEDQIRGEVTGSRDRIAEQLGAAPVHFCYPNGRARDVDDRVRKIVSDAQFVTALTAEKGLNMAGADPLMLKRIGMEPQLPRRYFVQQMAGFRLQVRRL